MNQKNYNTEEIKKKIIQNTKIALNIIKNKSNGLAQELFEQAKSDVL